MEDAIGSPFVAFLLLRNETIEWLLEFLPALEETPSARGAGLEQLGEFWQALRSSVKWRIHNSDWCLSSSQGLVQFSPDSIYARKAEYWERAVLVDRLASSHQWAIIPWGVDYTGMMLAFVAQDSSVFEKMQETLTRRKQLDLLASSYETTSLRAGNFSGAILGRSTDLCGEGIWNIGGARQNSALVLRVDSEELPLRKALGAEVICEVRARHFGHTVRSWLRVFDEAGLLHYARDPFTTLIVSSTLSDSMMAKSLEDFDQVDDDPLRFGLGTIDSSSWFYIPRTAREKWEIYMNIDSIVTRDFLNSEVVQRSPFYSSPAFF